MITEDQSEVIAFLSSPSTYGGSPVERLDTHSSIVFLSGERALKLKRAVLYDYLDFSTRERRKILCEAEVRVNRRTAPTIYRGVLPVTRERDGSLALAGAGAAVDWVVDMSRFPQDQLFDRLAERGSLERALMRPLAAAIRRFHDGAERARDRSGRSDVEAVIAGNAAGMAAQGAGILDQSESRQVAAESRAVLERCADLLDRRRDEGFVRHCHGDLHLRNIVLLDGSPVLFDAIEFNDDLACIDVLYDLAFLLMDLWRRDLTGHANEVLNGYAAEAPDVQGLALLPLFLSMRAAVRAKTGATTATLQTDAGRRRESEQLARDYLRMAATLLRPPAPVVVAVGGHSGSGKSTLARALGPSVGAVPGALVLRSDEFRKQLCGVSALTRLGAEAYTPTLSRRVYAALEERAALAIEARHAVVVDAVFERPEDRAGIERVAAAASVPFIGVWLDAPEQVLVSRIEHRVSDASDADAAVVRLQRAQETGPIAWHRLDAGGDREAVRREALAVIRPSLESRRV